MATTTSSNQDAGPTATEGLTERQKYLLEMRKRFCPPEMIDPNTMELSEVYFRPPKPKKILTIDDDELVKAGLEKFGFGEWEAIAKEYFPEADQNEIRIKAMELVGKQDLREYLGKKLTAEELQAEREKNLKEGEEKKLLVWGKVMADERYGVLV